MSADKISNISEKLNKIVSECFEKCWLHKPDFVVRITSKPNPMGLYIRTLNRIARPRSGYPISGYLHTYLFHFPEASASPDTTLN